MDPLDESLDLFLHKSLIELESDTTEMSGTDWKDSDNDVDEERDLSVDVQFSCSNKKRSLQPKSTPTRYRKSFLGKECSTSSFTPESIVQTDCKLKDDFKQTEKEADSGGFETDEQIEILESEKLLDYSVDQIDQNKPGPSSSNIKSNNASMKKSRSIRFIENVQMHTFEIDDGNTMDKYVKDPPCEIDCKFDRFTKKFQKKKSLFKKSEESKMKKCVNVHLNDLLRSYLVLRYDYKNSISRWLITDSTLNILDEHIFKNLYVTRLEYPLISRIFFEKLQAKANNFCFEMSYIFVAYGFDSLLNDNQLESVEFLENLNKWCDSTFSKKIISRKKRVQPEKSERLIEVPTRYFQQRPIIVVITIPEIARKSTTVEKKRQHNEALRQYVTEKNNFEACLLDWAKLVDGLATEKDKRNAELQIKCLVDEMRNYGSFDQVKRN